MKAKERHKSKILDYIGNPDNNVPNRQGLASAIGISVKTLYMHFTIEEMAELEAEGLRLRRLKYAPHLATLDMTLVNKANEGDVQAIKLAYQRFEGWSEKQQHEVAGKGGGPVKSENHVVVEFKSPDDD